MLVGLALWGTAMILVPQSVWREWGVDPGSVRAGALIVGSLFGVFVLCRIAELAITRHFAKKTERNAALNRLAEEQAERAAALYAAPEATYLRMKEDERAVLARCASQDRTFFSSEANTNPFVIRTLRSSGFIQQGRRQGNWVLTDAAVAIVRDEHVQNLMREHFPMLPWE